MTSPVSYPLKSCVKRPAMFAPWQFAQASAWT